MLKKAMLLTGVILLLSAMAVAQQPAAGAQSQGGTMAPPKTHLKVGDKAPDFTLNGTDGKSITLSKLKMKKGVVLAFYPKAFTGG